MAKFGLYEFGTPARAKQEYEGDFLLVNGDIVCVVEKEGNRVVAAIRLAEGQSVKKVTASPTPSGL
jgi:hypothetical protein